MKDAGFEQITIRPFHNGFFGVPFVKKIFKNEVIPIPFRIPVPFSPHLIALAYKSAVKNDLKIHVELPEIIPISAITAN